MKIILRDMQDVWVISFCSFLQEKVLSRRRNAVNIYIYRSSKICRILRHTLGINGDLNTTDLIFVQKIKL